MTAAAGQSGSHGWPGQFLPVARRDLRTGSSVLWQKVWIGQPFEARESSSGRGSDRELGHLQWALNNGVTLNSSTGCVSIALMAQSLEIVCNPSVLESEAGFMQLFLCSSSLMLREPLFIPEPVRDWVCPYTIPANENPTRTSALARFNVGLLGRKVPTVTSEPQRAYGPAGLAKAC